MVAILTGLAKNPSFVSDVLDWPTVESTAVGIPDTQEGAESEKFITPCVIDFS